MEDAEKVDAADLRVFEAVARSGGMSRAAAELNTVQSNVTARIRALEKELQVLLFERHSRGVRLTAAGQRLIPYAARIRQYLEDGRRAVRDDGTPKGSLTIGSPEATAMLRLPPILAAYAAAHCEVDLVFRTGTTRELVTDVLEYRLDGAFVCGPVKHAELVEEVAFREELVILAAPTAGSLEEMARRSELKSVVLRAGCSYRERLEEILASRGAVGGRRLECGTIEAIISCVAAGLGVTLLPKRLMGSSWDNGRIAAHKLPGVEAHADIVFIRRSDSFLSSALAAFLQCARDPLAGVRSGVPN